jgi:hypothetical protein
MNPKRTWRTGITGGSKKHMRIFGLKADCRISLLRKQRSCLSIRKVGLVTAIRQEGLNGRRRFGSNNNGPDHIGRYWRQ